MTETSDDEPLYLCLTCGRTKFELDPERNRCPTCNSERIRPMTEEEIVKSNEKGFAWLRRLLGR